MTTYGVKVNRVNFTIAVVYLVPDADTAAVTAVYRKLIESENKYENFIAMGNFNLDLKTDSVKKKIAEHLGVSDQRVLSGPNPAAPDEARSTPKMPR